MLDSILSVPYGGLFSTLSELEHGESCLGVSDVVFTHLCLDALVAMVASNHKAESSAGFRVTFGRL